MTTTEGTITPEQLAESIEADRVIERNEMAILDRTGDTKLMWDPENKDEVEAARKTFDELVGTKKMMAFKVKKSGKQGEQIKEFDPTAERMIITPALVGG
jgi:tRNA U38,U39,U40 pseudouridine synthase TruA